MKIIILIVTYFGKLPCWFNLWLESCKKNESIDWLLVTDDRSKYNYPTNIRVEYMNIEELNNKKDYLNLNKGCIIYTIDYHFQRIKKKILYLRGIL